MTCKYRTKLTITKTAQKDKYTVLKFINSHRIKLANSGTIQHGVFQLKLTTFTYNMDKSNHINCCIFAKIWLYQTVVTASLWHITIFIQLNTAANFIRFAVILIHWMQFVFSDKHAFTRCWTLQAKTRINCSYQLFSNSSMAWRTKRCSIYVLPFMSQVFT